jgi:hypothetical protein
MDISAVIAWGVVGRRDLRRIEKRVDLSKKNCTSQRDEDMILRTSLEIKNIYNQTSNRNDMYE